MHPKAAQEALKWYVDHGVDVPLNDEPVNRLLPKPAPEMGQSLNPVQPANQAPSNAPEQPSMADMAKQAVADTPASGAASLLGKTGAREEAVKLAKAANTLDELREAIAAFDGVAIKRTATNLVFADGNAEAPIMLIGEAPGADEDRQGKPFVGVSGQLLDKILACIDISRTEDAVAKAVYISNILNWRPPGNRTPNPAEIEVSLPFIERHIQLAKPKLLIFCGGVSAKSLLGQDASISRLRKTWHDYMPQTPELAENAAPIPAIATYHPSYLLRTPGQKKAVWADMLALNAKRKEMGLIS